MGIGAPALFQVSTPQSQAASAVTSYAATAGVPAGTPSSANVDFYALSLDEQGNPISIMNSNGGFALLFGTPSADTLTRIVAATVQPFPVGLTLQATPAAFPLV